MKQKVQPDLWVARAALYTGWHDTASCKSISQCKPLRAKPNSHLLGVAAETGKAASTHGRGTGQRFHRRDQLPGGRRVCADRHGEDLPKGVLLQWADWVSSPRYLFDSKLPALENFAKFKGELRALCFSDDPWATRPAVELLTSGFTAIKPEVLTLKPSDVGAKAIGHFGFFRPEHRDTLWRGVAEWIQGE